MKWLAFFCLVCRKLKIIILTVTYMKKFKTLISQVVNTVSKTCISRVVKALCYFACTESPTPTDFRCTYSHSASQQLTPQITQLGCGRKMRNTYNANSSDLCVIFTTELEDSFLEPLLFAIKLFLLFPSRTSPLHQMLSISASKETEMVQAGASFLLCVQQVHGRSKWHLTKQTYSTVNESKHTNKEPLKADFCHGIHPDYHRTTVWVCSLDMQHAP